MPDLPSTMHAAYITGFGPAEAIRYGQLPLPPIGPTDVLVKVEAVVVNPVDTYIRAGSYRTPIGFPFILGRDLVGTVAAAGTGAVGFSVGAGVWCNSLGHAGRQGSFADYASVPAERLYHLPAGVDPLEAVAVLHPAATAFLGLFRHARLGPADTVYVGGGGGNVGGMAIRLAAGAGAHVVASARRDDFDRCRAMGARHAIDYRDPALAQRIRQAAPHLLDVHWDTSGRHDLSTAVSLLAPAGRILISAGLATSGELPVRELYRRDAAVVGFVLSNAGVDDLSRAAALINRRLAEKTLPARIERVLPLAEATAAHLMLERGQLHGRRVVLRPPAAGSSRVMAVDG